MGWVALIPTGTACLPERKGFSSAMGRYLVQLGEKDPNLCAVTAAMKNGTGLNFFAEKFPIRFFDTAIAEEHAVTFCAGLATQGFLPVFAVYSTFFQRSYDQILHDCAIEPKHVVFMIDRAGFSWEMTERPIRGCLILPISLPFRG